MDLQRLEDLISDYLDGTLPPEDVEELTRELEASPEARRRLLTAADQDLAVQELARSLEPSETAAPARKARHSLRRAKIDRSGTGWKAALIAAGVLFGIALVLSLSSPGPARSKPPGRETAGHEEALRIAEEDRARAEAARREAEARLEELRREEERLEAARKKPAPAERDDLARKADEAFREIARRRKEEEERLARLRKQEEAAIQAVEKAAAPEPARPGKPPTATAVASVERVDGEAWAVSPGKRTALAPGDILLPELGLDVGSRGRLALLYPDWTRLELGPGTKVRGLARVGKWLELLEGQLLAKVTRQPAGRAMAIGTPHAEALVLGTTLRLVVDSGSTRLDVEEGRVRLKRLSDGKTVDVSNGHFAVAGVGLELASRALTLYAEDFDSGRLAGWTFPRAYPWTLERASPRGLMLTSPKYPLDQNVQESDLLAILVGKAWKDCAVEVDVRPEEYAPSGGAGFTLYARYQDWNNLVRLEYLRSPQGQWTAAIDQGRPGAPGDVSIKPAPALEVGRTYRVRLEARGEQVSAFLDGRELVRAPTLFDGPGTVCFGAPVGRWSFDALKVAALPPPPKGKDP